MQNDLGVKPGDRVGLWLKNCPEFIPALFGILQTGAVVVPINNFLKPAEVSFILGDAGADVLITDATLAEGLPALIAARPGLKCVALQVEQFVSRQHRGRQAGPADRIGRRAIWP